MHNFENSRIINNTAICLSLNPDNNYVETRHILTNEKYVYTLPDGIQDIFSSMYNHDRVLLIGSKDDVLLVNLTDGGTIYKKLEGDYDDIAFLNSNNLIHYKTDTDKVVILSANLSEKILEVTHTSELFQNHSQLGDKYFFCEPKYEETLQLWDIQLRKLVFEKTFSGEILDWYDVSHDGKLLIVKTDKVLSRVFCLKSKKLINKIRIPVKDRSTGNVVAFPKR